VPSGTFEGVNLSPSPYPVAHGRKETGILDLPQKTAETMGKDLIIIVDEFQYLRLAEQNLPDVTVGGAIGNLTITVLLDYHLSLISSFYIMLGLAVVSLLLTPLIPSKAVKA